MDDSPLSVIIGLNQSGKTSLAQAVGFGFSGTVGEINDLRLLVKQGYADLRVRLNLPGWTIERSLARGPKVSEIAARLGNIPVKSLPLLFQSSACLNCGAHLAGVPELFGEWVRRLLRYFKYRPRGAFPVFASLARAAGQASFLPLPRGMNSESECRRALGRQSPARLSRAQSSWGRRPMHTSVTKGMGSFVPRRTGIR